MSDKINSIVINFISIEQQQYLLTMQMYESSFTPQRRKVKEEDRFSKSIVKQRLDSLIHNDYAVMRKGKEMDQGDLLLRNHNVLVLEYVRGIYDQYHIADPLAGHLADSRLSLTPSVKKTKKKKMHLMSIQAMKYQTPTQLKANNQQPHQNNEGEFDIAEDQSTFIKKDMFQNDTTIRAASLSYFDKTMQENKKSQFNYQANQQQRILDNYMEVQLPKSQVNKFNKYTHRFQMEVEKEIKIPQIEEQGSQHSEKVPKIQIPRISPQQQQQQDSFFLPPMPAIQKPIVAQQQKDKQGCLGYVDESFRYCVGCQQALLHANIKIHQKTCSQFQQVFKMPADEIVQYLKKKIKKFEDSIKKSCMQLMRGDVDDIQKSSMRMMEESNFISNNGVITSGFQREYEKVVDIGKRWCLITQEINKVNWFLKIRERIKQQFEL